MLQTKRSDFPDDFLWGASTASHQVEGGTVNQWSVWELAHASERAKQAHDRLGWQSNWLTIQAQATDPANYVSGQAVDHYNRYKIDFDIAAKLNLNSLRFGIEWSRVEPAPDTWNMAALQHYHDYIAALRQRGIEPVLNLWHWTMPTWFTDKGGFSKRANLPYFDRFVRRMAEEFGHEVTYVITMNEPNVYSSLSYLTGEWPPQDRSLWRFGWTFYNLVSAHKRAYKLLKQANPQLQVGVAQNFSCNLPRRPGNWLDETAAKLGNYGWNWWYLNRIKRYQDFVGFNFYHTVYWRLNKQVNPPTPVNDMGWYMEPSRLYDLLVWTSQRYRQPIIVTENGVADATDQHREWWLKETLAAMASARRSGVDLRGYFHWSLLDNFEWAEGWWPKFGLVAIDRANKFKRTVRPSGLWWAKWLKHKNIDK